MIYIDCTLTHSTNMLTGIQRVVYNVIDELLKNANTKNIIQPMILSTRGFVPIPSLQKHYYEKPSLHANKKKYSRYFQNINVRKYPKLYQFAKYCYFWQKRYVAAYTIKESSIIFKEGDTILFLDSTWNLPMWKEVEKAKSFGAKIVFVIYDFIPILFPQFCEQAHTKQFELFFKKSLKVADQYVGISQTVMKDISSFAFQIAPELAQNISYDYFYLGANFSKECKTIVNVRKKIIDFFNTDIPIFLTVSTIEPRKKHILILNAFEKLKENNIKLKLCFIGKVGWKMESFIKRLYSHPSLEKDLLIIHDANDAELLYTYQKSYALLFASVAEGFGLPIIEALNYSLPVIASDIEIHQEIGKNNISYFKSNDINDLILQITKLLTDSPQKSHIDWISWSESAQMLFNKLDS